MGLRSLLRGRREQAPPGSALARWGAADPPATDLPVAQLELLALDIETTGLDPRRHEVLAIGYLPVLGPEILLSGAAEHRIRPRGEVGDSATLHGLTDDALADAPTLEQVLPQVLEAMVGGTTRAPRRRVLLAHFAQIETDFLAAACRRAWGAGVRVPALPVVDTLQLERSLLHARPDEVPTGRLRLDACRRAHRLPRYGAHSAVTDALACAELFLAQCAELEDRRGRPLRLSDVLTRGRL